MEVGVESEKCHPHILVGRFINVDHPHSRLPSIDRIARVGAISGKPIHGRSIPGIYLIIFLNERADGVGLTCRICGDKLGDNIDAVVETLAG